MLRDNYRLTMLDVMLEEGATGLRSVRRMYRYASATAAQGSNDCSLWSQGRELKVKPAREWTLVG